MIRRVLWMSLLLSSFGFLFAANRQSGDHHAPTNAGPAGSDHPAGHHGPNMRVEFENDSVEVLRIHIAPHEKLPMHDLTPRVVVFLTDAHLQLIFPDGHTQEANSKAGDTSWASAQRHAGENLSDAPIEFIAVVPKK